MWRRRSEREWRKAELLGRFSEQDGYSVFVLRTQHAHINCFCPGSLQLSLRLLDIDFRSNAALKAAFIQLQSLLVICKCGIEHLFFSGQAAALKVFERR